MVAFALYTQDAGTLKLTGQLYPLMPEETREVRLETKLDDKWKEISRVNITYPGWSAHFRIKNWDSTKDIPYRRQKSGASQIDFIIQIGDKVIYADCTNQNIGGSVEEKIPHKVWKYWMSLPMK
mgnify:CR=1 FL=1